MEEKSGISAEELLENTLQKLSEMNSCKKIIFPERVSTIIADDSDDHRIRQGYMGYKRAMLLQLNGKMWAISIGKAWGDYPARPYNSDILAIEISALEGKTDKEISERIQELIHLGEGFRYTLIIAMQDGRIKVARNPSNPFRKKILESMRPVGAKFVAQRLQVSKEYISPTDLLPMIKSPVRYKSEFAEELAKQITEILSKE